MIDALLLAAALQGAAETAGSFRTRANAAAAAGAQAPLPRGVELLSVRVRFTASGVKALSARVISGPAPHSSGEALHVKVYAGTTLVDEYMIHDPARCHDGPCPDGGEGYLFARLRKDLTHLTVARGAATATLQLAAIVEDACSRAPAAAGCR